MLAGTINMFIPLKSNALIVDFLGATNKYAFKLNSIGDRVRLHVDCSHASGRIGPKPLCRVVSFLMMPLGQHGSSGG